MNQQTPERKDLQLAKVEIAGLESTAAHFLCGSESVLSAMQTQADIELGRSHELPLDLQGARHCRIGIEESLKGIGNGA